MARLYRMLGLLANNAACLACFFAGILSQREKLCGICIVPASVVEELFVLRY